MLINSLRVTRPTKGVPLSIGKHFDAQSFSENQYGGAIDPPLMVDHFRMREPPFRPSRHVGFSAVTYVFEDSRNPYKTR